MTLYSTDLCKYIISSQQKDLLVIFANFSDKVSDPESNIFFIQNDILDRILVNVEKSKKRAISISELYKGIDEKEKKYISSLNIDDRLLHDAIKCSIMGLTYFDKDVFMRVLDNELETILTKYNLNSDDDYNKLYKFLSSLKLTLQSSDDMLGSLSNQYVFFKQHSNNCENNYEEEVITIYGVKHYKIDILKDILNSYQEEIEMEKKNNKVKTKGYR